VKHYQYDGKKKIEGPAIRTSGNNANKTGYTNSAFNENEKRESSPLIYCFATILVD
jgi:hypothetical protein